MRGLQSSSSSSSSSLSGNKLRDQGMSDYISEEILVEILKRLPVDSLIKCRCVCKSWYTLITSSAFISIHLTHSIHSNKSYPLMKKWYFTNPIDQFFLYNDNDYSFSQFKDLFLPFKRRGGNDNVVRHDMFREQFEIVGSCNGLVCVSDHVSNRLYLWNPSIREYITIFQGGKSDVVGFGFDFKGNYYKVVRVVYGSERDFDSKLVQPSLVQLYELSSNSWRTMNVENLSYVVSSVSRIGHKNSAYLNSSIHWLATNISPGEDLLQKSTVGLFDFTDEVFEELILPDGLAKCDDFCLSLAVCGQSLALIHYGALIVDNDDDTRPCFENCSIWVMKDYGMRESWSKMFTVNLENHGGLMSVLSFRGNGQILLQTRDDELTSYDPNSLELNPLGIRGAFFKVHNHMESLILLRGLNRILGMPRQGLTKKNIYHKKRRQSKGRNAAVQAQKLLTQGRNFDAETQRQPLKGRNSDVVTQNPLTKGENSDGKKKRRRKNSGSGNDSFTMNRETEAILSMLSNGGGFSEVSIRQVIGDNPDTSKALRTLLKHDVVKRMGSGGRTDPYIYMMA